MLYIRIPIYEQVTEEKIKAILPPGYYAKAGKDLGKYNVVATHDHDVVATMEIANGAITIGFINVTQADKTFVDAWATMHPNHDPRSERWMKAFGDL